jgi:hypothetical protein
MESYLFSGYARLPHSVSHQALYERVGVIVEIDQTGTVLSASSTLLVDLSRDFFGRIVLGRNLFEERDSIEQTLREHYFGQSQGALISALRKLYEAIDRSGLSARGQTAELDHAADAEA